MANDPKKMTSEESQASLNSELVSVLLEANLDKDEEWAENRVYYQPPEDTKISYPCIVYRTDPAYIQHADNLVYRKKYKYEVTSISYAPHTKVFDILSDRRFSSHARSFVNEGLNHHVFDLFQ